MRNTLAARRRLWLAGGDFLVCIVVTCYGVRNQRDILRNTEGIAKGKKLTEVWRMKARKNAKEEIKVLGVFQSIKGTKNNPKGKAPR